MAVEKEEHTPTAKKVEVEVQSEPIVVVVNRKKKNKKKRRYTRGLRTTQEFEMGATRATQQIGKAVARGLSVYRKRRNKSSRKRRDGALRDIVENVGKAMSRGLRSGSNAPYQFAKAVNSRRFSKQVRDAFRLVAPPLFR